ncbi:hypothetical protein HETIRDRAFT_434621 [Heterobasidion irregulare TC 32-1]|uniref:Uncharacterized protein n=1 Tax=Heterobasidion irregulare (strain TC 32-1) TaxID=747525 RepID=W4K485_HETIT|nr:uncharacterized protein HETIRDRAFT_434621 [Heterobasidion irregulare TC 32-1]ETW80559.1 hypothetical protein HETIRDRAFT_434621 [Heterobasidion irregulare TC 32-1]
MHGGRSVCARKYNRYWEPASLTRDGETTRRRDGGASDTAAASGICEGTKGYLYAARTREGTGTDDREGRGPGVVA